MKKFLFIIMLISPVYSQAANWYVSTASQGSNNGTSWNNCWGGLNNVVWGSSGVKAGDTLYIDGGASGLTYTSVLNTGANGSAGNVISIRVGQDAGHNGRVTLDGGGSGNRLVIDSNYITIDGSVGGITQLYVINGPMGDNGQELVVVSGNNDILGYVNISNTANAVNAYTATYFEIHHLNISGIINDHLIRAVGSSGPLGSNRIHDCILYVRSNASGQGPDAIQGTYTLDIYNNRFVWEASDNVVGGQHQDMIQCDFHRVRIYNNRFEGGGSAVVFPNIAGSTPVIEDLMFYNNVIVAPRWAGVIFDTWTDTTQVNRWVIANNTFVDAHYQHALEVVLRSSVVTVDITIKNNIFYNSGNSSSYPQVLFNTMTTAQCAGVSVDYNLFNAGPNGATIATCNNNNIIQAHPRTLVPSFTNYTLNSTSSDLSLKSTDTAAMDKGISLSSYFTTDILGTSRPQGATWGIGAYEFVGTAKNPLYPTQILIN